MKKVFIIFLSIILLNQKAFAITLSEALLQAYKNNPELNAERENLKISQEELNIAKSEFLPTVTVSSSRSQENTQKLKNRNGTSSSITNVNPETQSIKLEQKLFRGLGGLANLEKNKIGINIALSKLLKVEQEILYKAVEAYSGLILASEKLDINQENVNVFERTVETAKAQLERAQITLADLAQAESSLASAQAKFIEAKNEVVTAKLIYEKVIGLISDTKSLKKNPDIHLAIIPNTLNNAIKLSKVNNPDLIIATLEYQQSESNVKESRADLSPSATLSLESKKIDDVSSTYSESDKDTITATISWPIFQGGKNIASLKKSKNLKNRKKLLLDHAIKSNDTNVASTWSIMESKKSLLNSVSQQVKAAEIANEGITLEYESGLGRSTLDVMQSNSILLDSKESLANSKREYLLSQFKLLQSVGLFNNNHLKLQQ